MVRTLVEKELKAVLTSPKFFGTFGACSALLLLSVAVGIREHEEAVRRHDAAVQLAEQTMSEQSSWMALTNVAYRRPDPLNVFAAGTDYDVGRLSSVSAVQPVKLRNSVYSDDPIFAVFRFMDFTFIVQVVLSMFAIVFTYDAVNGEREAGTLKLVFANAVPRSKFILGKLLGAWLALVLPLAVPVLLGVLLVVLRGVALTGGDWIRLGVLCGASLLYFTFFVVFGILASSLTRRSSVSFLACLVGWVLFVLVLPRAGVVAAGQLRPVPSAAEVDGLLEGYSRQRWARHFDELQQRMRERRDRMAGMSEAERAAYEDENMWDWMEWGDESRRTVQADIDAHAARIQEEVRAREAERERMALRLARVSPAAAFQVTAATVAGTDQGLARRYREAMKAYKKAFVEHARAKQAETDGPGAGTVSIQWSSSDGFKMNLGRDAGRLDLSGLPRFEAPRVRARDVVQASAPDLGLLAGFGLTAFAGAFVAFLRYDVR